MNRLSFLSQRGSRTNRLSFPVPEGFGDKRPSVQVPDFREGVGKHCLHLLSLSSSTTHLQGSTADLQSLTKDSSGFCTAHLSSTASLSVAGLLTACSEGPLLCSAGLLYSGFRWDVLPVVLLISGSRRDVLLAIHLNSVSARVDLRVVRLKFFLFLALVLFG
ncbi:hypothetical protein ATANTOWER_007185 [Ataeniobius toweri]|uniref:Uncharacterized protein n=1 Tax=Ataeniobius toweri TaxID=208326 RepID=A0ABU7BLB9_9TELE|nr:hypothetical protein [Ataeniobius toweri]